MSQSLSNPKDLKSSIKDKLTFPRAVLLQLKDTHLFNPFIDQALKDVECLLEEAETKADKPPPSKSKDKRTEEI